MEDDAPLLVDVSNVFGDIDIATGDSLSVVATGVPGSTDVFDSFSLVGGDLTMVFAANQSGVGSIQLTATDTASATVAAFATVSVAAVNDAPFVSGSISNLAMTEDDPTLITAITAFDDVDIVTSADVLSLSVTTNTNPGLFSDVSFSGTDMNITLAPDANGDAILTVIATDIAGATSAGVTFTVSALGV
ncbi:MAG: hypothetical protein GXP16_15145, partial [Gammaproteobacteria bacterium]|nr:hypothetical protein [Gammaproteobacteria bacterium]